MNSSHILIYKSTDILDTIYRNARYEFGIDTNFFTYYEIPKLNAFSYLFATTPEISNVSVISEILNHSKNGKISILNPEEINTIASTVINSYDLSETFNKIKSTIIHYKTLGKNKDVLIDDNISILRFYLEALSNYEFEKIIEVPKFCIKELLYILFLSLPQTKKEDYDTNLDLYKRKTLVQKIKNLYNRINQTNTDFADKIFLLSSLLEGLLWDSMYLGEGISIEHVIERKTESQDASGYFVSVNLYDILLTLQHIVDTKALEENSFYLKLFNFYIFSRDYIEKSVIEKFVSNNFWSFIEFGKTFFPELNKKNASYYKELLSLNSPKSIIHGLINIFCPLEIQVADRNFNLIESYTRDNTINDVKKYVNPWASYKISTIVSGEKINITDFGNIESGLSFTDYAILINTNFFSNFKNYILIKLDESTDAQNNIILKLKSSPFSLKELIEKYSYINNTVNYNINSNEWFNKAFCDLYKIFDETRFKEKKYRKSRNWEIPYLRNICKNEFSEKIVIYDMGIGYGRLEKKVLKKILRVENLKDDDRQNKYKEIFDSYLNLKKLIFFGFDISNNLLEKLKLEIPINILPTKICDFRNIDYIPDIIGIFPDLILFNYTTFGYFEDDSDNKSVLIKSLIKLKPGGSLIIEQFNPKHNPDYVNNPAEKRKEKVYPEVFTANNQRLVKTSYYDSSSHNYTRYYGNYFYFNTENNQEHLIKCDSYDIKLYNPVWFYNVIIKDEKLNINDFNFYCSDKNFCEQENVYELDEYSTNDETSLVNDSQIIIRIEKINDEDDNPPEVLSENQELEQGNNNEKADAYEKINFLLNDGGVSIGLEETNKKTIINNQNKIGLNDLDFINSNKKGQFFFNLGNNEVKRKITELIIKITQPNS